MSGFDQLKFVIFFTYDDGRQQTVTIPVEVQMNSKNDKKDTDDFSSSSSTVNDGGSASSSEFIEMPSVKNTIEVKRDQALFKISDYF